MEEKVASSPSQLTPCTGISAFGFILAAKRRCRACVSWLGRRSSCHSRSTRKRRIVFHPQDVREICEDYSRTRRDLLNCNTCICSWFLLSFQKERLVRFVGLPFFIPKNGASILQRYRTRALILRRVVFSISQNVFGRCCLSLSGQHRSQK